MLVIETGEDEDEDECRQTKFCTEFVLMCFKLMSSMF